MMAQREVVDRWLAPPGGRLYGAPSVLLGLTAEPTFRALGGPRGVRAAPARRLGARRAAAHGARARRRPCARWCGRPSRRARKTLVNALAGGRRRQRRVAAALAALGPRRRRPARGPAARRLRRPGRELAWSA